MLTGDAVVHALNGTNVEFLHCYCMASWTYLHFTVTQT